MKKRISTRAICLLIAGIMLIGALTVSAVNGSPYENLKNAVFDALFLENFTMEMELTARIDGQVQEHTWARHYFGDNSNLQITGVSSISEDFHRMNYNSDYFRINTMIPPIDGQQWYSVNRQFSHTTRARSMGHEMFGVAGRSSNQLRLAEVVLDLLVGDLKNNLTMTSQSDGSRRISGAITESQVPEIVRLLIDIAIDEQQRWNSPNQTRDDFRNSWEAPMRSITIDRVQGRADIDEDGNLVYGNILGVATGVTIFGDTHVFEVEVTITITDIGTTVPAAAFQDAYDLFEEAFAAISNRHSNMLVFTLDEDGNVDPESFINQGEFWAMSDAYRFSQRAAGSN